MADNNFFQLVESFKTFLSNLNTILLGDETESITVDGVEKPSITKDIKDKFTELQIGQRYGVIAFRTYAELDAYTPTTEQQNASFKVTSDDTDSSLNGYYTWVSGTTYSKDADLVVNEIDEANTSDPVSGAAVYQETYKLPQAVEDIDDLKGKVANRDSSDDVIFSLQDEDQREVLSVLEDGTVKPLKLNIPEKATLGEKKELLTGLIMSKVSSDSGDLFVLEDSDGRVLARIADDGTFYPAKLNPTISLTPISSDSNGGLLVIEDSEGKILARFLTDGSFSPEKLDLDKYPFVEVKDTYLPEVISGSLYVNNLTDGMRYLITDSGNPSIPVIDADDYVTFNSNNGYMSAKVPDGEPVKTFPLYEIAAFGDSITAANWINTVVAPELGVPTYNMGASGYGCADIAIRQGGLVPLLTAENNTILATGATTITAISPTTGYSPYVTTSLPGSLGGVAGVLSKDVGTSVWTFTRNVDGSDVAISASTPFISSEATTYENMVQTLFMGRNNVESSTFYDDVIRDMAGCVANLKPYNKRFVVVSITNAQAEPAGSANYEKIISVNNYFAETYGEYYFDLRSYMIENGLSAAGITPTAEDLTAISEDRIPPSLLADNVHPNATGYQVLGGAISQFLQDKGWF